MTATGPEAELMLLSAGTAVRRAAGRGRAHELAVRLDWDLLTARLAARRLLPQLGPRVIELCGERAPERFALAHESALTQTRRQGALLGVICGRLLDALACEGVRAMPLKGPFLGEAIYGEPGRRPAGDLDLLLAPRDLRRAIAVARRSGYEEPREALDREGLPLLHHALRHSEGVLPPLELHWRVHWYEREFATDMLRRAERTPAGVLRAQPADELACLLLCYARDGFLGLRIASDLGAWWDALGEQLPDAALDPIIARHPALRRALASAIEAAALLVGLPPERLTRRRAPGVRERLAVALANPTALGDPAQLSADVSLIDWLLTPARGQLAYVRRRLVPSREVLDARAQFSGERRVSPLGHGTRVLGRYALRLARACSTARPLPSEPGSRQAHSTPFSGPTSTSSIPL